MSRQRLYRVVVNQPEDMTDNEMANYISDAVSSWRGSFEPPMEDNGWTGHPLHILNLKEILVRVSNASGDIKVK